MRLLRPLLTAGVAALALSACSVLPKAASPDVYLLPATPLPAATPTAPVPWTLRLDKPQATRPLEGARIAVVPTPNVITVYKGARWSDDVPSLLRDRLLDAFRDDGQVTRLSTDDDLRADLELAGTLRAFQSEYRQGVPQVVIRYDAQLVDARTQRILAMRSFTVTQPVDGREVPQVVLAFGHAGDALAAQLVAWTLAQAPSR
jgi:cholesterol transport system auxiliary component